jgi:hypothetical protein
VERIQRMPDEGITVHHVVTTLLWDQVVPLQHRSHPMWKFTGARETTRLRKGRLEEAELDRCINQLLGGSIGVMRHGVIM